MIQRIRHHIGNLSQVVKGAGKGGGFIYPFALSLSPNKSVLFVVHFYFQRLNNTPKRA
jgi:hypothetical protein